jgi:hypothetical protein
MQKNNGLMMNSLRFLSALFCVIILLIACGKEETEQDRHNRA